MSQDIAQLRAYLSKSNNGTSILFTGAGFSFGSKNVNGIPPKDAKLLSQLICNLAGIPEDDDLYYSSEYFLETCPHHQLIDILKSEYTINSVSSSHERIASKNWRRIYTTNYDHVFEIASNNILNVCESVNISNAPSTYSQKNQCVHLNGSIENLTSDAINEEFKLSDSSYVTPDTLNNSKWKSTFSIDIEHASAIFFVGYSMYDLDIKRILKNDLEIKSKTFFIVKPNENPKEIFKLKKYGTVLDIGVDAFSELVSEIISEDTSAASEDLEFFKKIKYPERDLTATDKQTKELFLKGVLIESEIYPSTLGGSNYLIKRENVERVSELVTDSRNLIISGGIASGKTIYAKQIVSILSQQGRDVFYLDNEEGDYKRDSTIISEISNSPIFVIDNAFRHEAVIIDLFTLFGNRATFILAGRSDFLERTKIALSKVDFQYIEENVEHLSSGEISDLNNICNFIGYWGTDNSWSKSKKEKFLSRECEGKMSSILLKFFKSKYVQEIFTSQLTNLKKGNNKEREIIFIVTLLGMLPFSPRKSLISDLCGNTYVFEPEFKNSVISKILLNFKAGHLEITSGILSKFVLDKYFSGREIVEKTIELVSHFETIRRESTINDSVFKELMRFKNISYMLPEPNRASNLTSYFNRLKSTVSWLKYSPHFWLQFGMANMFLGDFPTAKQNFDNAYGSAKNETYYDTGYIDNQMVRWHLEFGITLDNQKDVFEHLYSAYRLLASQTVDYYFCKQAVLFERYYEEHFNSFSKNNKTEFEKMCKNLLNHISKADVDSSGGANLVECEDMMSRIIKKIIDKRMN
jgi:hypothetical protein